MSRMSRVRCRKTRVSYSGQCAKVCRRSHTSLYRKEIRSDTVQLQQCINSRHFSCLWQTHWPVPKADGGEMTAVNYSGMLLIWKSVFSWKQLYFFESVWICSACIGKKDSGCHRVNNFGEWEEKRIKQMLQFFVNFWPDGSNLRAHSLCACIWEVFISAFPFNPLNIALSKAEYEFETCYVTKCPRSSERVCSLRISDY